MMEKSKCSDVQDLQRSEEASSETKELKALVQQLLAVVEKLQISTTVSRRAAGFLFSFFLNPSTRPLVCLSACLMDGWMDGRTDGWMDGWMDSFVGQLL